eukprot:EG_transcript_13293
MPGPARVAWARGFSPPSPEECRAACLDSGEGAPPPEYDPALAGDLFRPITSPTNVDDWLAQYVEDCESYAAWRRYCRRRLTATPKGIHLVPVGPFAASFLEHLREFTALYYSGLPVTLLDPVAIVNRGGKYDAVAAVGPSCRLVHRCAHRYDLERPDFVAKNHVQLKVGPLLRLLTQLKSPAVQCTVGVTMYDLYDDHTDSYSVGMAAGGSGVGIFSLCRYNPKFSLFKRPSSKAAPRLNGEATQALVLQRSCKTLVHEIAHNYYIGHCVYFQCVMGGSGHLEEDFRLPMHLCPIDLRKLQFVCKFKVVARYQRLRAFYERHRMAAEAEWVARRLLQLGTLRPAAPLPTPTAPVAGRKRPRDASAGPPAKRRKP